MVIQIPNLLTLSRMILVLPITWSVEQKDFVFSLLGATLFVVASLTDFLDGWLARRLKQTSDFGKIFDPLADKILINITLISLLPEQLFTHWIVIILLMRDTVVGGVRTLASLNHTVIAAKDMGKTKTVLQMIAVPIFILHHMLPNHVILQLGTWCLWLSVGLSLVSGIQYILIYQRIRSS